MRYSDLDNFKFDIKNIDPYSLIKQWFADGKACAFDNYSDLYKFIKKIEADYPRSENILIAGTANWQYSLNPKKEFSKFSEHSDIDVALISPNDFEVTWNKLRNLHRKNWYLWGKSIKASVLRTGQNVYCGFISPKYIPDKANGYRFEFLQRCNSYSTSSPGHREVNLMFFKSNEDVIDYYIRGLRLARGRI